MKIGINGLYQIKQIRDITDIELTQIILDESLETYPFKNWSDIRIPESTPALYKNRTPSLLIGEWVQPTGGHDAYDKGDKVIYKGVVWTSKIDGNATIPDGDEPYNRYWSKP